MSDMTKIFTQNYVCKLNTVHAKERSWQSINRCLISGLSRPILLYAWRRMDRGDIKSTFRQSRSFLPCRTAGSKYRHRPWRLIKIVFRIYCSKERCPPPAHELPDQTSFYNIYRDIDRGMAEVQVHSFAVLFKQSYPRG